MSAIDDLKTRRNNITAELAALTASKAGGKPNVSVDGQATDHVGYKDGLYRELKEINGLIADLEASENGPFAIESLGI